MIRSVAAAQYIVDGGGDREARSSVRLGSSARNRRRIVVRCQEAWDVERLCVGDGSLVPRTLSVDPSPTMMALVSSPAEPLDDDSDGCLA